MSHFDDVDFIFWGENPKSVIGAIIFILIGAAAIIWSCCADSSSEELCKQHGEKYIDSRIGYTLCEKSDGTVIKR